MGLSTLPTLLVLAGVHALPGSPAPRATSNIPADTVWNSPRVLELIARARDGRASTAVDPDFRAYRARARGFVYFFFDRPDSDERNLVKADQIALELFWAAPNRTHQRIVGLRDRKVLPTNIRYHLDHLTVVQDDFGNWIRLGDGDEVARVLHPLGPGSERTYDFLLADSLTLSYGGGQEEVRVYEIRVRPKAPDTPAFVGSIFLDRDHAAVVRMSFTFTPASYVDPYLDYIRISLDNALWLGRYWLPYRQEAELRRELPVLDFMAGSIIRGRFEIGDYEFNPDFPPNLFQGRRVSAVPERERRNFPFEEDLFADLKKEGLTPAPSLEQIRSEAARILRTRALSGLSPLRLHLASVSRGLRYNRAEGLALGGGVAVRPVPGVLLRADAGFAFGPHHPVASLRASGTEGPIVPDLRVYWNDPRDLGPLAGASGLMNTLAFATLGEDYLDPFYARGADLRLSTSEPGAGPVVGMRFERQFSARRTVGDAAPRGVLPVEDGILGQLSLRLPIMLPAGGRGWASGDVGRLGDRSFQRIQFTGEWVREGNLPGSGVRAEFHGGLATPRTPVQSLFFLGGRGSLPGFGYREFAGTEFGLARVSWSHPLLPPWVGFRTHATLALTHLSPDASLPPAWRAHDTDGLRASMGAGLSLGWDVLFLDLSRGLGSGGSWELSLSVAPRFHPWL
ncbi:MAG: hypothetical protein ACE5GJ_02140 [Gemmatimonadota bacterium]